MHSCRRLLDVYEVRMPDVLAVVQDYAADLPKLKIFDPHQSPLLSMILDGVRLLKAR